MWGLNRPDSDLDIRGVYLDPVDKILGLSPGDDTVEGVNQIDDNTDLQLYEFGKTLRMLAKHNGNVIELLLSPTQFYTSDEFTIDWKSLARSAISKEIGNYYLGYFNSQRDRAAKNRGSKALVYTFREMMSGIRLMVEHDVIFDFHELKEWFETKYYKLRLLDQFMAKPEYWRLPCSDGIMNSFEHEWVQLTKVFITEREQSTLRSKVDITEPLNQLLLDVRYRSLR
jgi:predicted nucleotidyltransferase